MLEKRGEFDNRGRVTMLRPIRGKIKRLIGRDVSIYIRNRRRRSTVVEAHVRVDDRSRGAYLSILLSVCAVRETGNTGGNYRPVPKCSRAARPSAGRGWKADRANCQSRSRACTWPLCKHERGGRGGARCCTPSTAFLSYDYFHSLASSRDDRAGIFK